MKQFHRLLRFLNANQIGTLPLVHESGVGDKIIIIKAYSRGERSVEWGEKSIEQFHKEIPAFFNYLINEHQTPDHLLPPKNKRRFPVIAYKNADVMDQLFRESKAAFLKQLLDDGSFPATRDNLFEGTEQQLYDHLQTSLTGGHAERFRRVFGKPDRMKSALDELCARFPEVVKSSELNNIDPVRIDGSFYYRVVIPEKKESEIEESLFKRRKRK